MDTTENILVDDVQEPTGSWVVRVTAETLEEYGCRWRTLDGEQGEGIWVAAGKVLNPVVASYEEATLVAYAAYLRGTPWDKPEIAVTVDDQFSPALAQVTSLLQELGEKMDWIAASRVQDALPRAPKQATLVIKTDAWERRLASFLTDCPTYANSKGPVKPRILADAYAAGFKVITSVNIDEMFKKLRDIPHRGDSHEMQ